MIHPKIGWLKYSIVQDNGYIYIYVYIYNLYNTCMYDNKAKVQKMMDPTFSFFPNGALNFVLKKHLPAWGLLLYGSFVGGTWALDFPPKLQGNRSVGEILFHVARYTIKSMFIIECHDVMSISHQNQLWLQFFSFGVLRRNLCFDSPKQEVYLLAMAGAVKWSGSGQWPVDPGEIYCILGGGLKYFLFSPYLGKWSNLTNIFQMGWNHQLVYIGYLDDVSYPLIFRDYWQ